MPRAPAVPQVHALQVYAQQEAWLRTLEAAVQFHAVAAVVQDVVSLSMGLVQRIAARPVGRSILPVCALTQHSLAAICLLMYPHA